MEEVKNSLEEKVKDRTASLKLTNRELKKQNTQLEQFNFISAHNLVEPVAGIQSILFLLSSDSIKTSESKQLLDHVKDSTENPDQIIKDLSTLLKFRKNQDEEFEVVNLSKQTDFTKISDDQLIRIENKLNNRSGKIFRYKSPDQIFAATLDNHTKLALIYLNAGD